MPYFHSAINVFKWLSLSSGFVIHSRNDLLKIEEKKKWTWVYFCVSSEEGSGLNWDVKPNNTSQQQLGTAEWWVLHFPRLPSGWQQWAESPNRRLPLSDYNLWSISIIGGVCRDSYSNNYLDWSVSKATNIPPSLSLHTNSDFAAYPLVACLFTVKKSLTFSFEKAFV